MRFAPLLLAPPLLAAGLAACATASARPRTEIRGVEWSAVDVNGIPVAGGRMPTLRLERDKSASGNGGCNSFTSNYRMRRDSRIEFGVIATTEIACPGAIGEQEARYLSILDSVETYSRYGDGSLSLIAPDGRAIRFRRR